MKTKFFVFILILLLVGSVTAQDKRDKGIVVRQGIKAVIDTPEQFIPQITGKDKTRIVLLTSYISDGSQVNHYLQLSSTNTIDHYIEYTAVLASKVRFMFIWTGPEWFTYTTDWSDTKVTNNHYNWLSITTNTDWIKGTYRLTIIAEQKTKGSGAECVHSCVYRLY